MNSIVCGDLRIDMLPGHGGKIGRIPPQAQPEIHPNLRLLPPGEVGVLFGRDAEIAAARAAAPGEPVEFHGACGFGKSALLRHVAALLGAEATAPVVYLRVGGNGAGDMRQPIVAALYSADTPVKPTPQQRTELLAQARATILLDDVTLSPRGLAEVLDDLPQCTVILASDRPVLGRSGRSIPLPGLPAGAALDLLRSDLGRDLTPAERAEAEHLRDVVEGKPLHLRQAAALVRDGRHSFAGLARAAERDPFALDRLSVNALSEPQRRAMALLAFAAGALLPADLVANITGLAGTWTILTALRGRGLAEQDEDQFGLPVCHADDYRDLLAHRLTLGGVARMLADWVGRAGPGSLDAEAAIEAVVSIIGYAAERGEWAVVARLAEKIEPVLAVAGRWDAWGHVLAQGLTGARHTGNLAAQAQMTHQLGVCEFAANRLDEARAHWQEALRLREQINDAAGAAVTRSNLGMLRPATAAPGPRRWHRLALSKTTSAVATLAATGLVAAAIPLAHHILTPGKPRSTPSPSRLAASTPAPTRSATPGVSPGGVSPGGGGPGGGGQGGGIVSPVGGGTSSHGSAGRKISATVTASPAGYTGSACPQVFTFTGVIGVSSGPVAVRYQWVRSDGGTGPGGTIDFTGTGPQQQTVTVTWTLSASGTFWEAIQFLSPAAPQSNHATVTLNCQAPVTAAVTVSPTSYTGSACPQVFTFTGVVSVSSGPVAVRYQWVRSDGGTGPGGTIDFTGTGPQQQTVTVTWTLSASGTFWEAIQFLSPAAPQSNQATFTLNCQGTG